MKLRLNYLYFTHLIYCYLTKTIKKQLKQKTHTHNQLLVRIASTTSSSTEIHIWNALQIYILTAEKRKLICYFKNWKEKFFFFRKSQVNSFLILFFLLFFVIIMKINKKKCQWFSSKVKELNLEKKSCLISFEIKKLLNLRKIYQILYIWYWKDGST